MLRYTLIVMGEASKTIVKELHFDNISNIEGQGLMGFLRAHKIPVASSCYGDGVCRRCKITLEDQTEVLSCMTTLHELFHDKQKATISISYL